jgi:Rrf2 family protein
MSVSAKVDYACQAVLGLALRYDEGCPIRLKDLATAHRIPSQFLTQIFQQLKSAGLVESIRGASGGYLLSRAPSEINVWEVVCAVSSASSSVKTSGNAGLANAVQQIWDQLEQSRRERLESTTFAELMTNIDDALEPMYYI